jgi:hypothetical protein
MASRTLKMSSEPSISNRPATWKGAIFGMVTATRWVPARRPLKARRLVNSVAKEPTRGTFTDKPEMPPAALPAALPCHGSAGAGDRAHCPARRDRSTEASQFGITSTRSRAHTVIRIAEESTDPSLACRPYATPSSISSFDRQLSDAHTAENESVKSCKSICQSSASLEQNKTPPSRAGFCIFRACSVRSRLPTTGLSAPRSTQGRSGPAEINARADQPCDCSLRPCATGMNTPSVR